MNELTLKKLEFDHVRQALAAHCACGLGQALARALKPSSSPVEVRRWLAQVGELLEVQDQVGLPPLGGMRDLSAHLAAARTPAGIEAVGLAEVQSALATTGVLHRWLAGLPPVAELLRRFADRVVDLTALADAIDLAIDARGIVRDSASPRLSALRCRIEDHRAQIDAVFKRLLKQPRYLKLLQYPNTTFHDDRVVLPLKAEYQGRIPGIIHRSSDTGATLFVEPAQVVELNNAIAKLRTKEHEEISRILSGLARLVHLHETDIIRTLDAAAVLDLIAAKVRYAGKQRARCPQISDSRWLQLHGARHPVLLDMNAPTGAEVVPIDVRLADDFDLLVLTGPNTGGKTVALKTVGLLAAMTQAGIPIPVDEGSVLPVYDRIFIDIGDEQSIQQSLSTFSGHLANICSILRSAGRESLVLIDELGAGTDPDEGSAIGWAVMDELLALGCTAVVTTHLSQLKAAAYTAQRVDNASVEFDLATLKPTYVLRLGEPGNSNAIAIAERLGLPPRVIARARRHLDDQHRALARAIEGTQQARRQSEEARKQAAEAQNEALRMQRRFEEKAQALEDQRAAYADWLRWVNKLAPGDPVYVSSFGKQGQLVRMQLHKQKALVAIGAVDHEVQLSVISRPED